LAGVVLTQMDVNIVVHVGLAVMVGLTAKNVVLIVVFASDPAASGARRILASHRRRDL
jgi:multidrug efflux pump subunit AcrB